jgi:hypothetical protein
VQSAASSLAVAKPSLVNPRALWDDFVFYIYKKSNLI